MDEFSDAVSITAVSTKKRRTLACASFFIQSAGLVCHRRQADVISEAVWHHLGVFLCGLITYITALCLHATLRVDYIPSATDYMHGMP